MLIHPVTKNPVFVPKQAPDYIRAQYWEVFPLVPHQGKMFCLEERAHFKGVQK